jgi:hypothetical protein
VRISQEELLVDELSVSRQRCGISEMEISTVDFWISDLPKKIPF